MDLIKVLRLRTQALSSGQHTKGLQAVLQHVEVAIGHLRRGQRTRNESLFTDAIYRTNQAFEGSLKEAYRVLADQDPNKLRPYDIEMYLQKNNLLRPRVLSQFTNYRKEWRNPSTHDYLLDFNEDEALLAIVSVCAFAIVLTDQIAEKLSYEAVRAAATTPTTTDSAEPLLDRTAQLLERFAALPRPDDRREAELARSSLREAELLGAIAGFLSKALSDTEIATNVRFSPDTPYEADLVVSHAQQKVLVEVKQAQAIESVEERALAQVMRYMEAGGFTEAIIYIHPLRGQAEVSVFERRVMKPDGRVLVVGPMRRRWKR